MRVALVDTTASTPNSPRLYPIALLKIGAYLKSQGHSCELFMNRLPREGDFNEIWISTLFTYDIPKALGFVREAKKRARKVVVGGIAATLIPRPFGKEDVSIMLGLYKGAEKFVGDYTLLGESPQYSIVYTSRGCVRNCGFCMVRKLEPEYKDIPEWHRQIIPGTKEILFYDNNWLAKPIELLERDIKKLREFLGWGKIRSVDFNQGLDARLMTEEKADLLEGIPIKPVRFAFDWLEEDGYYQDAIRMMAKRGHSEFTALMLYNYRDSPTDFYYRIRQNAVLTEELGIQVKGVPMKYHPVLEINARNYVGIYWTPEMLGAFRRILAAHSISGQISCLGGNGMKPLEEFDYWFGKDAREFVTLLNYPDIRVLIKRKKAALRHMRLGIRGNDKNQYRASKGKGKGISSRRATSGKAS